MNIRELVLCVLRTCVFIFVAVTKMPRGNCSVKERFVLPHGSRQFSAVSRLCHLTPGIRQSIVMKGLWNRKWLSSCESRSQAERGKEQSFHIPFKSMSQ